MSDSRRRTRDSRDDEPEVPIRIIRVVAPRRANTPAPSERADSSEPSEESEPSEDMGESHPILSRSPPPVFTPIASPPVPSSPVVPNPPSPAAPSPSHRHSPPPPLLLWDWMPDLLNWWRRDERIPQLPEASGPPTPIPTLTGEAVHLTVPVLVTRMRSHERILDLLERRVNTPAPEIVHLQQQLDGAESELSELRDEVVTTHTQGQDTREEVASLRQQLAETQQQMEAMRREMAEMRAEREKARAGEASTSRR